MKAFTVESGKVIEGVRVDSFILKGAGVTIPAVIVGEEGRGRKLGVLPVQLLPNSYKEWQEKGTILIHSAKVGQTKAGKPKLIEVSEVTDTGRCICVFRTRIGYRGGNSHTGDCKEEYWVPNWFWRPDISALFPELKEKYSKEEAIAIVKELDASYQWDVIFERKLEFLPFPGEILCEGIIAQGAAGRMGNGTQLVAVMPAGIVFRTGYSGRLYGAPSAHYYVYRDGQILSATWEEREVADIF